jgi:hypothetical protein
MENKTNLQYEIESAIKSSGIELFDIDNASDILSKITEIYVK